MDEKEMKELFAMLEQAGMDPQLCDTPVPYFRNGVPAGYPEAPGDYDGEMVLVPRSLLKSCDFVVHVKGDSMTDAGIDDGDDVMVKHCDMPQDGDTVVALLDGETTLKTYLRDTDGTAWLVPANAAYQAICLSDFSNVYILGRVTSVHKPMPHMSFAEMHRRMNKATRPEKNHASTGLSDHASTGLSDHASTPAKENDPSADCFRFPSEFTRQQVAAVVKAFYHGEHADLALIEIALFDHGQLKKRNAHTAFVRTLMAWDMLKAEEKEMNQILSGIKDKFKRLPKEGYKNWDNVFLNDKNKCAEIGKILGPTMIYKR